MSLLKLVGKAGPWTVVAGHCACRFIEGGNMLEPADRLAWIEKTTKVRIAPWDGYAKDGDHWRYGPDSPIGYKAEAEKKGLFGFCQASRDWCDEQLKQMGWELT